MNFKEIQDIVEKKLNVDLFIKSRLRPLVEARFMYFLLCKEFSDEKTLSKIGKSLNKDHATVLHGIKTLNNLMLSDAKIYKVYIELYDLCSKISGAKKKKHTLYFELSNKIRNQNKLIKELQEKIKHYESIVEGHFTESR